MEPKDVILCIYAELLKADTLSALFVDRTTRNANITGVIKGDFDLIQVSVADHEGDRFLIVEKVLSTGKPGDTEPALYYERIGHVDQEWSKQQLRELASNVRMCAMRGLNPGVRLTMQK